MRTEKNLMTPEAKPVRQRVKTPTEDGAEAERAWPGTDPGRHRVPNPNQKGSEPGPGQTRDGTGGRIRAKRAGR